MPTSRARERDAVTLVSLNGLPVLGLDIGGVLVDRVAEDSDTSFFGRSPMATPIVPGAFEAVQHAVELFDQQVHVISKAGPRVAALSRRWLTHHGFIGPDMIPDDHVHFVRLRPEKAPVAARLGLTHFVDDRLDVLEHLVTVEHRYLLTGGLGSHAAPTTVPAGLVRVDSWSRLTGLLQRDT